MFAVSDCLWSLKTIPTDLCSKAADGTASFRSFSDPLTALGIIFCFLFSHSGEEDICFECGTYCRTVSMNGENEFVRLCSCNHGIWFDNDFEVPQNWKTACHLDMNNVTFVIAYDPDCGKMRGLHAMTQTKQQRVVGLLYCYSGEEIHQMVCWMFFFHILEVKLQIDKVLFQKNAAFVISGARERIRFVTYAESTICEEI